MADSNSYQARFKHGDPTFIDITPGSALVPGEVLVTGNVPVIAHEALASGVVGAVAQAGGVYECVCAAAIANGKALWWDDTNNRVTETATSNTHFGTSVSASYTSDTRVLVKHEPQGLTGAIV